MIYVPKPWDVWRNQERARILFTGGPVKGSRFIRKIGSAGIVVEEGGCLKGFVRKISMTLDAIASQRQPRFKPF